MDAENKSFARVLFKNKIHTADGQAFEDIFIRIMNYAERDFQAIKPWGNIGDRKNDGYIKIGGIFYQVWAPEDIRKSYVEAVNKLKRDFKGLKSSEQWDPINEFYFVVNVNDKYRGVNADCEKTIQDIKETHNLKKAGFLTPKDLENTLFDLEDDQILSITGQISDSWNIKEKFIPNSTQKEILEKLLEYRSCGGSYRVSKEEFRRIFNTSIFPQKEIKNLAMKDYIKIESESFFNREFVFYSITDKGENVLMDLNA
jgi:hypothetical protein